MGAPIVFVSRPYELQWWKQGRERPELVRPPISPQQVTAFFDAHRKDFTPEAVYRAKTWGRFSREYQLGFVDLGLMPLVESEIGHELSRLIERCVVDLKSSLWPGEMGSEQGRWLLESVFWILAAKILRDKRVPTFSSLRLPEVEEVFARVGKHYRASTFVQIHNKNERKALSEAAGRIDRFSNLANVTTECLAYIYENTLISKETRSELGTHSTPSYLVDYIIWQLVPWIREIPEDERNVFEPACGHGAFLVSTMRQLREMLSIRRRLDAAQEKYFQKRLHGIEIDPFAREIARLSLTLADIPNPDGWDLQLQDMFLGDALQMPSTKATVVLANPPFEDFKVQERARYRRRGVHLRYINRTAEMLGRILPNLQAGAVFGVVVPQGLLHSRNAADLRKMIATGFEISEICLFADKMFTFSDMESAIIIGRKARKRVPIGWSVRYRRVREKDAESFKRSFSASTERNVSQRRFSTSQAWEMRMPDLDEIWTWLGGLARMGDLADVGKGLSYKAKEKLPRGVQTISDGPFKGAVRGFARFERNLCTHSLPAEKWMNLDPSVIRDAGTGTKTGCPQILLNYARVSRGPWRLKALIDRDGHAVTSNFISIRPKSASWPLEFVWAVCNSPLANAYIYAYTMKRHVLVHFVRSMPIPNVSDVSIERISTAARSYIRAVTESPSPLSSGINEVTARDSLMRLDAEVLRLYGLPPRLERQLLDLFAGWPRSGVPFVFERYFPEDFEPCFHLYDYLSEEYRASTAEKLRERHKDVTSPTLLAALKEAVDAFKE